MIWIPYIMVLWDIAFPVTWHENGLDHFN